MSLSELRNEWEKGLTLKHVFEFEYGDVYVVLHDKRHNFVCHRYFKLGNGYEISVDYSETDLATVFEWLDKKIQGTVQLVEKTCIS